MKEAWIKEQAIAQGFDLAGISPAQQFKEHLALKKWIQAGKHASMHWLERNLAKRLDPLLVLPEAKSVIILATNYNSEAPYSHEIFSDPKYKDHGWIARYAWGSDYHDVLKKRFLNLCTLFKAQFPNDHFRAYTDTGPISERVFAKHGGLGWIGKNTCLIHPKKGSFLFLTAIITTLELDYDQKINDYCGKCTRCIDVCPTNALQAYELDARKCISYLTIEHRDTLPKELQKKMGRHIFGCDLCQDVCPWNQKSPRTRDPHFQARPNFFAPKLRFFFKHVEEKYPLGFTRSPLKRSKKQGLLRNIQNALNNIRL